MSTIAVTLIICATITFIVYRLTIPVIEFHRSRALAEAADQSHKHLLAQMEQERRDREPTLAETIQQLSLLDRAFVIFKKEVR